MVKKLLIKIYEYLWRKQSFVKDYILKKKMSVPSIMSNIFDDFHLMSEKPYEYTWQIVIKNRIEWTDCLNLDYKYGNSYISRPYFEWKEKKQCAKWFNSLKKIWDNRNVVFIEGNKSRLGFKNALFNNAKSIKRILCPAKNVFNSYEKNLEVAKSQSKDTLILISLGSTATVLANDLAGLGYWAIDIEYEWFKMGATEEVAIDNKYTNEAVCGDIVNNDIDEEFKNQIIAEIL